MQNKTTLCTNGPFLSTSICRDNAFGVRFLICDVIGSTEPMLLLYQYRYTGRSEELSNDRFLVNIGDAKMISITDGYKHVKDENIPNIKIYDVAFTSSGKKEHYYFELVNTALNLITRKQFEIKKKITKR